MFVFLNQFPLALPMSILTLVVLWIFFVAGADAGAVVLGGLSTGGPQEPKRWIKLAWGAAMAAIACILLVAGGLGALQSASVLFGVPFGIIMVAMCRPSTCTSAAKPAARTAERGRPTHASPEEHAVCWRSCAGQAFAAEEPRRATTGSLGSRSQERRAGDPTSDARRSLPRSAPRSSSSRGLVAGCGGGGGSGEDEVKIAGDQFRLSGTQRDAQFAVGSESFTEQEVLGNIAIQVLEAADATVIDRTGLGGNEEVRQALESGEIDLYWEYTATGWLVHLSETDSISDPREQYEAVARQDLEENGIKWLDPAPGNDTYAIAASEKTSRELGVETISDLKRLVEDRPKEATLCLNNDDDFLTRFDGLPGLERAYGFEFPEENLIETSVDAVYDATDEAEICNFGVVFTTSGFIRELDLRLLEDDEEFFAVYNPALTVRQDVYKQYPQLRRIFVPISEKLDTETLRELNYAVDVQGKSPESVARSWLRENGFIE